MRLDINYRGKNCNKNSWRLNNTLLNNIEVIEEIRREIKILRNKWQWKHKDPKSMGFSKSNSKREVYSNTILPQETRKASNRQPNFTPKATGKRRRTTKNPKISRRQEIIKIQAEINEKENKETVVIIKPKAGSLRR